ncbi:MAG TPA: serine/threonine-protein kinase [Actinomycetes bacterium]|nr:serine/threonine-protein kinase [Actinomycetes bacterium]
MTETTWSVPDRVIAGRYQLDHPIGQGGMGEVWAGYDLRLDRRVAVKLMKQPSGSAIAPAGQAGAAADSVLAEQAAAAENARQRFLREVRITAGLAHPGIPAVHDTGIDEATGELFLVMQLLTGAELADLIAEHDYHENAPPVGWAAAVAAQLASVLTEVHRISVVHRDIKPRNLFITPGGIVKVLDFGVAALLGAGEITRLTMAGQTVGTPPYMSPEQTLANAVGPATDLYALGCVLHETLTGHPPFQATGGMSVQWHHVHTPPIPVRTLRPDVPEPIETLVLALLAKSPEQRPDAGDIYETLLPYARTSTSGVVRDELDPTRPFTRPMAATPRRDAPAPVPLESASLAPLSESEADAATAQAEELAKAGHFARATDVLLAAIARCGSGDVLAAELRFSLANVLFVAGSYRRALAEFQAAGAQFTERYGAGDRSVLDCRYYAATCRAALGENTEALLAFREFLHDWSQVASASDERALDVRRQIGLLLAGARQYDEARTVLADLHRDLVALRGESSPDAAAIAALLARISRYDT